VNKRIEKRPIDYICNELMELLHWDRELRIEITEKKKSVNLRSTTSKSRGNTQSPNASPSNQSITQTIQSKELNKANIFNSRSPHRAQKNTNYIPNENCGPVKWIPKDNIHKCLCCNTDFNLFVWKHHCRMCGGVICSSCSSRKDYATGYQDKRVRMCDLCYEEKKKKECERKASIYSSYFDVHN